MTWNDPLRRWELAQRLERLRDGDVKGDPAEDPTPAPAPVDDDPGQAASAVRNGEDPGRRRSLTEEELRSLIARAVAESHEDVGVSPPQDWTRAWWRHDIGPTEDAVTVFRGSDGTALAWVISKRTGLPMVAVEERQAGSRQQFWIRRHVVVDMLDGRLLDIAGAVRAYDMEREVVSATSSRTRLKRLKKVSWQELAGQDSTRAEARTRGATRRWQESLVAATPEAVELVAAELAARYGLAPRL